MTDDNIFIYLRSYRPDGFILLSINTIFNIILLSNTLAAGWIIFSNPRLEFFAINYQHENYSFVARIVDKTLFIPSTLSGGISFYLKLLPAYTVLIVCI